MGKLTKEQENRFEEKFPNKVTGYLNEQGENIHMFKQAVDVREIKSHLADEIALALKEEKLT